MRTLLVLLPVLLGADGGSPHGARRPATYREARRAFVRAFASGAFDEGRGRWSDRESPPRAVSTCATPWPV